jgi:hypothetical protein
MAFDDRAQSTAKTQDEFGQFGAGYDALGRPDTPSLFRTDLDGGGPRSYELWSLYYEAADDDAVAQIRNDLNAIYPGQLRTTGAFWFDEGNQVGTENVYSTRTVTKTWSELNPDYDPNEFLEDGTTPNPNYDPNFVIRVTGDVEETYVSGHTGTPLLPIPPNAIEFMPDVDDIGTRPTELSDVNKGQGQADRNFL